MSTTAEAQADLPFHLRGNYAPVEETTAFDLEVSGSIPAAISGQFLRNGPNPKNGDSGHWFVGDGMIHGIRLDGGKAEWYRNRYLQTRALNEPDARLLGDDGTVDRTIGVSNTHVVRHADKIMALVETSFPFELNSELDSVGVHDFGGKLESAMTAHPKICPVTGEMHFFGYGFFEPWLTYHRVDAAGELIQSEVIDVAGPTMIHDFSITETHVLFMDLPVVFDLDLAMQGAMPYSWDDEYAARVGIMERGVGGAPVQWFDVDPCYVFHPMNSFDVAAANAAPGDKPGEIVLDTARYPELWRANSSNFNNDAVLHRWRFDLATGKVKEEQLDDAVMEFPRVDERLVGLPNRYGYAVGSPVVDQPASSLIRYDLESGTSQVHDFGADRITGEAVMIPASDTAAEDDGWLLSYVYNKSTNKSDVVILDAADIAAEPVATIHLPVRVPFGFHGSWMAD